MLAEGGLGPGEQDDIARRDCVGPSQQFDDRFLGEGDVDGRADGLGSGAGLAEGSDVGQGAWALWNDGLAGS